MYKNYETPEMDIVEYDEDIFTEGLASVPGDTGESTEWDLLY